VVVVDARVSSQLVVVETQTALEFLFIVLLIKCLQKYSNMQAGFVENLSKKSRKRVSKNDKSSDQ
jgi:hypothetical protein